MQFVATHRLVKGEDTNHHGTLYAGRGAEWMVEAGFIAAAAALKSADIVCMRINSLLFRNPVPVGQMLIFESGVVHAGRSSLTAYVKVTNGMTEEFVVDGFFTFVHVNAQGGSRAHGLVVEPSNDFERELHEKARSLIHASKAEV